MKRSLSKTLAMFIAIMLLISVLTACGDGDKKVDEQTPSTSENVEQEDKSNEEDGQ